MATTRAGDPIVCFEGVSKRYYIQRRERAHLAPTLLSSLRRMLRRGPRESREEVWALHDVSFEVQRGEVFAICGANGAGKSTLLKLLSRVTPPTTGWIGMNGRLANLLEVGTGFHPELTGRENVFLNGVILGLTPADIRSRFDRIVEFSGVERYIDTPVKRYSSGMYVRLAFSIAAHLDHELMIVDEVLAVGDASFRERCLKLIEDAVRDEGRTVLFVSHDVSQVKRLAHRALLLEAGRAKLVGTVDEVLATYMAGAQGPVFGSAPLVTRLESVPGLGGGSGAAGAILDAAPSGGPVDLVLELGAMPDGARLELAIDDAVGLRLWTGSTWLAAGDAPLRCRFAALPLTPGSYKLVVSVHVGEQRVAERSAGELHVAGKTTSGQGPLALEPIWTRG